MTERPDEDGGSPAGHLAPEAIADLQAGLLDDEAARRAGLAVTSDDPARTLVVIPISGKSKSPRLAGALSPRNANAASFRASAVRMVLSVIVAVAPTTPDPSGTTPVPAAFPPFTYTERTTPCPSVS